MVLRTYSTTYSSMKVITIYRNPKQIELNNFKQMQVVMVMLIEIRKRNLPKVNSDFLESSPE